MRARLCVVFIFIFVSCSGLVPVPVVVIVIKQTCSHPMLLRRGACELAVECVGIAFASTCVVAVRRANGGSNGNSSFKYALGVVRFQEIGGVDGITAASTPLSEIESMRASESNVV